MAKRKNNKIHHPETKKKVEGYLEMKLKDTYWNNGIQIRCIKMK